MKALSKLIAALVLFAALIFIPKNSVQSDQTAPVKEIIAQSGSRIPVRLRIPAISVDSFVESVGLTSEGAMDTPKIQADVGWFMLGQRPGDNGTAVIDGHYGAKASIFNNLSKLKKGDRVYIEDDQGTTTSFIVRESRSYDPKADATEVFGLNSGSSQLNLITCEGIWNKITRSYSQRLVVFADKE